MKDMEIDIEDMRDRFEEGIFNNLDRDNFYKIVRFLLNEKCDYVDEIVEGYLDLFIFPYEEFINKYNKLNEKYNGKFLEEASVDLALFEEFYEV